MKLSQSTGGNNMNEDEKEALVDKVIDQIKSDIEMYDLTAIDEMLMLVDPKVLKGYLAED